MSYRGWLLAAGLLVSGGPLGADKEVPIGAWFPGMIEGETTTRDGAPTATDRLVWERRLASTPSMPGAGVGSLRTPHYNQPWMDLVHAKGLKVQLHSWRQPEEWTESSRNYWTRTFSPIRSAGRSPTATGLCGMPRRIGSLCGRQEATICGTRSPAHVGRPGRFRRCESRVNGRSGPEEGRNEHG